MCTSNNDRKKVVDAPLFIFRDVLVHYSYFPEKKMYDRFNQSLFPESMALYVEGLYRETMWKTSRNAHNPRKRQKIYSSSSALSVRVQSGGSTTTKDLGWKPVPN